MIQNGATATIEYDLRLDDGEVVDTTEGGEPLVYVHGQDELLPAFESQLEGLGPGDEKEFTLSPDQGYGAVDPAAFLPVEIERIPEEYRSAGALLIAEDEDGNERPVRVREVSEEAIVLDWNHPLAGETLHFSVRVVDVTGTAKTP